MAITQAVTPSVGRWGDEGSDQALYEGGFSLLDRGLQCVYHAKY